jgi:protein-L-isoaspartate(D-aspartate) O-methyltransferase
LAVGPLAVLLVVLSASVDAAPADDARAAMVEIVEAQIDRLGGLIGVEAIDPRVLAAMRQVPRHDFVPGPLRPYAYGDHPLPVGHGQNIAAPLLVALMTHLVAPAAGDVVYETGTGAGYHAAVLSLLVAEVVSVEVVAPLAQQAAATLAALGYANVQVHLGDGYDGWPAKGPFDVIVIKEAIDHPPAPLVAQLAPGGRMVLPLGPADGPQFLTLIEKDLAGRLRYRRIMPVRFSPFQGGRRT